MVADRPNIPDFDNPPVVEVVLSIQFEPLEGLHTAHLGLLWGQFRDQFPRTEDQPPLNRVIEDLEPSVPPEAGGIRIEFFDRFPSPRLWFLNEDGTELIQVQQDRFIHNWRTVGEGKKYPRYERIRESFSKELTTFQQYLSREKLGNLGINQCEVTYVNHIVAGEGWERHSQVEEIFALWSARSPDSFLPEPEDADTRVRYVIRDTDEKPIGRLHVEFQPVWRISDRKPMYVLKLTARGAPTGEGLDAAFRFLDIGRIWIVQGFAAITTSRMHTAWRRLDAR